MIRRTSIQIKENTMLGIALIFVGIVLVHNGVMFMSKTKDGKPLIAKSGKSVAFFNAIVGGILVITNLIWLGLHAPGELAAGELSRHIIFQNVASGLIFGVTYLFIAGNILFKLDMRPFGLFCLGASVYAFIMVIDNFIAFGNGWHYGLWLALLWITWFFLWFSGTLQFTFKWRLMEKVFPWISIGVGIIGAFIPAIFLLLGHWALL